MLLAGVVAVAIACIMNSRHLASLERTLAVQVRGNAHTLLLLCR